MPNALKVGYSPTDFSTVLRRPGHGHEDEVPFNSHLITDSLPPNAMACSDTAAERQQENGRCLVLVHY